MKGNDNGPGRRGKPPRAAAYFFGLTPLPTCQASLYRPFLPIRSACAPMMPHDVQTMRGPNAGTVDGSRRRVGAERCGFIDRGANITASGEAKQFRIDWKYPQVHPMLFAKLEPSPSGKQ